MLPLSIDSLNIAFSPAGVELTLVRGWWRKRYVDRVTIPVRPSSETLPWQSALNALQGALEDRRWQRLPTWIILSDRLVRYQLLPWLPELANPKERTEYARFHFRQVYGAPSDNWDIQVDASLAGMAAIACAIDKDLLAALNSLAQSAGSRIRSITPRFVSVINRVRPTFRVPEDEISVLALFETGNLTLAVVDGDRWKSIRQRFVTASPASCLRDALEQERMLASNLPDVTRVYLMGWHPNDDSFNEKIDSTWSLKHLEIPAALIDSASK